MGDRVLLQVTDGSKNSPVIYGHWSGRKAPKACRRLAKRMAERPGDVDYTAARLVQEMTDGDNGALSFGIWNQDDLLTEGDSHGDAGIIIIDVGNGPMVFKCFGGYLKIGPDGFPTE